MTSIDLSALVAEYDRALAYTDSLWRDLTVDEIMWRADENSSAIGWHLGHQAAVAHFMVRNLTAAEPSPDPELDGIFDSATEAQHRGALPELTRLSAYREAVAARVHYRVGNIESGDVGAPLQLRSIAIVLMTALVNHEYQHNKWIGEVRSEVHGKALPPLPVSKLLVDLEGYLAVA